MTDQAHCAEQRLANGSHRMITSAPANSACVKRQLRNRVGEIDLEAMEEAA